MRSVHDVVAPQYRAYVDADQALGAADRATELAMLERWDQVLSTEDESQEQDIYQHVAPKYVAYVEADESRSQDQKDRRKRLIESWRRRLEEGR
jgi:polynucleotide 5'-kinase involved in rRNA processing